MALSRIAEPRVLKSARVSANFLRILEANPLVGRSFLPEEDKPGAPEVAMISAELWREHIPGEPSIPPTAGARARARRPPLRPLPARLPFLLFLSRICVSRRARGAVA